MSTSSRTVYTGFADRAENFTWQYMAVNVYGGGGTDLIHAWPDGYGPYNDYVEGGGAQDFIGTGGGDDVIFGDYAAYGVDSGNPADSESDYIVAGDGNDIAFGQDGNDLLQGGYGSDILFGGVGNDMIGGGAGTDTVYGGEGNDYIRGNDYTWLWDGFPDWQITPLWNGVTDAAIASPETYRIRHDTFLYPGSAGYELTDYLDGGAGNDLIYGDLGNDVLSGGGGDDSLFGDGGTVPGDDRIDGGEGNDYILGESGNDNITGGAGDDAIDGSAGNDVIDGGDGNDRITASFGVDIVSGGEGNDLIYTDYPDHQQANDDRADGGGGNDEIHGFDGNDSLTGGSGGDYLSGGDGVDVLLPGDGYDYVDGGAGVDYFRFDAVGFDQDAIYNFAQGQDVLLINHVIAAGFAQIASSISQSSGHTFINFGGGDIIVLANFTGAVTAGDFYFY